ncbi:MAG TPA: helix-turn-helix transcriptional regulator [Steroidobacteraceae bacterium]|jgi:transcriptional regulator with XRE-family HTH domain|nr:helix-turn-helix transcriptional regulator [Steroidobacteraceae bacterium]
MLDTSTGTTTFAADEARRNELAAFLKSRRSGLAPACVGLKTGPRRRARGLLREEVAQLAGISPTWYVWLEQGRDIRPSPGVVEQLADALLLTGAERTHLFTLARPATGATPNFSIEAPDTLKAWIAGLNRQPAYVLNGIWDIIAWNDAACEMFGDFSRVPAKKRNVLSMIFRWQPWRTLFANRDGLAEFVAAQFRADTAAYTGHPRRDALLAELCASSPEFAALWNAGAVNAPRLTEKVIRHPTLGTQTLTYASLRPQGVAADVSVIVYTPCRSAAE